MADDTSKNTPPAGAVPAPAKPAKPQVVVAASSTSAPVPQAPDPAPVTSPVAILMTLVQGLHQVAIAESSQPKPSGKAWGELGRALVEILDAAGVAPTRVTSPAAQQRLGAGSAPRAVMRMPNRSPYARPTARVPGAPPLIKRPVLKAAPTTK
jgi:hypothetical protein